MEPEEGQDQSQLEGAQGQEDNSTDTGITINPAWNDALSIIPEQLHSQITPHFSKWDQNYQNSIQKVHSQYEPFKPFMDNGVQPDQINYGLSLLQAIESQPQEVLKALQDWIGDEGKIEQQGQQNQEQVQEPEWLNHPQFQRINQMTETMAQLLVQQREAQEQSAADEELEDSLAAAEEKYGEFDTEWVLTKLYNNPDMELDQAVEAYGAHVQQILANQRKPGPKVLGPGGSIPNQELNVKELDSKGTRNLVAQMLQQAAEQNR